MILENIVMLVFLIMFFILNDYLPRAGRKNILFGARVEEELKKIEPFSSYIKQYRILNLLFFIVFIFLVVRETGLNIYFSAILLLVYILVGEIMRIILNRKIVNYKKENPSYKKEVVVVSLEKVTTSTLRKIYYVVIGGFFIVFNGYIMFTGYKNIKLIPIHYTLLGNVNEYTEKSIVSLIIMFLLLVGMVLLYIFSDRAIYKTIYKIDPSNKEDSYKANIKSKKLMNVMLAIVILPEIIFLTCVNLKTYKMFEISQRFLGSLQVIAIVGAIILTIVIIMTRNNYNEKDTEVACKNDDDYWKFGIIYYNRNNSNVFVEKRSGVGVTINAGHPVGMAIYIFSLALIIGSMCMPIIIK